MRTKVLIFAGLVLLVFGIAFRLGIAWNSRNISSYAVNDIRLAFHTDSPVYGLPLAEYRAVLREFRGGQAEAALAHLEAFLDGVIYDAKQRRPLLEGYNLEQLDKILSAVSQYRQQYPRALSGRSDVYWTASRQMEIDNFLKQFTNN